MNVHTRHARMIYRDTQEMWNRECHSDALREMKLSPAEELQPIEIPGARWLPLMAFGLGIILTVVWAGAVS